MIGWNDKWDKEKSWDVPRCLKVSVGYRKLFIIEIMN